ncbi:MAG: hypothetical protein N3E41_03955 [Thermofilaceae archaeon]|nr:hypothetical protein [Thermofilaceae archaeon]
MHEYLQELARQRVSPFDLLVASMRRGWLRLQVRHNFYIRKYKFIDRRRKGKLTIVVLTGKYPKIWDVTFERLHAYSLGANIIVVNPDGLHGSIVEKICEKYDFSYFESVSRNFEAAQNFVNTHLVESPLILKMDDDVFLTENTIRNLYRSYWKLKGEGYCIGFLAPILNVNNVSYYHFLKILGLEEEYTRLFEKPIFARHWTKQRIWYDPEAAMWVWRHSLPLNEVARIFEERKSLHFELIPVRFSISCIMYEREFLLARRGFVAYYRFAGRKGTSKKTPVSLFIPFGDESSINYFANDGMCGRFLILDAFAGHLCYGPQASSMLEWFERNKKILLEDLKR